MSRTTPPQMAFSSGEIDPLLHQRVDYQRFQTGLAECRGFLPLAQGGFTRAPGTWLRGQTLANAAAVLLPFQFAVNDAVVLEFTPLKMRVWRYGNLVMAGPVPYELTTPFDAVALQALRWVQSADVIYLVDGIRPVQRLSRFANDSWTIAAQAFQNGPFRAPNLDEARTITASAVSGSVTLTASTATFTAAHVGSLIQIKPAADALVPMWEPYQALTVGARRRYGENYYELTAGTSTATVPPIHTEGEAVTSEGVTWLWLSDGIGVAKVTAYTNATTVTATILRPLAPFMAATPTYRWAEGAWSNVYGYPSTLEIYDQRLAAAATPSEPRTLWFSAAGSFADFATSTEDDGAFSYTIAGDGSINKVINLRRGSSGLHIFALGEEYSTRSDSRAQAIGPTTAVFGLDSSVGSSPARAIAPAGNPIFISRDRRRVLEIGYAIQADKNEVRILSRPSQHLGEDSFEQVVWQSSPEPMAWLRRGTGDMVAMVYDPSEEVLGWATLPVAGGFVEAMAVTSDPDGAQDIILLVVRRVVGGVTLRFVEEMARSWISEPDETPTWQANHLFCATHIDVPSPAASFTVPHLAGETVHAWTEAGTYGPLNVANDGTVTLEQPVLHATLGLLDETHRAQTLDIQAAAPDGSSLGRRKRVTRASIALFRSVAGYAQTIESNLVGGARPAGQRQTLLQKPILVADTTSRTGFARLPLVSGQAEQLALRIFPEGGAPLTITAIVPSVEEVGS